MLNYIIRMSYSIIEDNLDGLKSYRTDSQQKLNWSSVFVLPEWLEVWQQAFGAGAEIRIRAVREGDKVIGVAPLMVKDGTVLLIGATDVCDYLDFVVTPGREKDFFGLVLDDLKESGIRRLDLKHVRPDSTVMTALASLAESRGCGVEVVRDNVSFEMDLPASFDAYLESLSAKQRHEVRRKLRRLNEEGQIEYRFIHDGAALDTAMDTFFKMFVESRQDKADFMTEKMRSFFRSLADAMTRIGLLKLGVLELDGMPLAEIMCFDYNDCIYLYNSGYDPAYVSLSAGLLSKVLAIKDSIEKGRKRFDFLKGEEIYKHHLGGREVPLYRCRITIKYDIMKVQDETYGK
jgi:CelD/BcsL family acetyltransferase involved in cellulose biosynthesis